MWGVYRFKQGFGDEFTPWIGAWDFLVHRGVGTTRVGSNDFSRWQRCGTTEVVTTNRGDISAYLY